MPKHKDSREMCINIAKKIVENKSIFDKLKTKKYIQMKELSKIIDVHPKTVERNRLLSYVYVYYLIMIMETLNRI